MNDQGCVAFLQWALPQLRMQWPGFRRVRSQVCKRLQRRVNELQLGDDVGAYRGYLQQHPEEWQLLDSLCRVTISRFYRDKRVFGLLAEEVLPQLARHIIDQGGDTLHAWSIGCASGEEPYSLTLVWHRCLRQRFPDVKLHVLASDADARLIARAQHACYQYSSIKNLPPEWREEAFRHEGEYFSLRESYRQGVKFLQQDIRDAMPAGRFHLILCRNLVFTYFTPALQQETGQHIYDALLPGGALVLGIHEQLPEGITGLDVWSERLRIFHRA